MNNRVTEKWRLLALITILTHCLASAAPGQGEASRSTPHRPPLGSFNFDFSRLGKTEAEQIKVLQKIGYTGLTMKLGSAAELQTFDRYRVATQNTGFKIYAGFIVAKLGNDTPTLHKHLDQILKRLKSVDGKLWVIIRENTPLKRN
jgi:hypothetical protein